MTTNAMSANARRWITRGAAGSLLALGAAMSTLAAAPLPGSSHTVLVGISGFSFTPREIVVKPGSTVTWANHDQVPHTVTSKDKGGELSSQALDTDDTYVHTFTRPGDYAYYCTVHPFMTGVVHVRQ